jgi:hypothetical protein
MIDEKYRIIHIFHLSSVLQITLRLLNLLRSACTLTHLKDGRQVSKLDYLVTVQRLAIKKTQGQTDSQHLSTMNHGGPIANATLQKKATAACGHKQDIGTVHGDKQCVDQTFHS